MTQDDFEHRKGVLILSIALVLITAIAVGAGAGYCFSAGDRSCVWSSFILVALIPFTSYILYKKMIFPYYRRLEDSNLELHLKQEELLDTKDDLFIKFLGIYDVNYAVNSPRLFAKRLEDVADITARVMEADACFIYLYDKRRQDLVLSATNGIQESAIGTVRIPLGEGVEGWVARRLEPLMLKDYHADARFKAVPGLALDDYLSVYCLPLYVYSNGDLVGLMVVYYRKAKSFADEEINFFTTLSGIISTTVENEQLQGELRRMNVELEQWVAEKTEELRASEERYRTLVENACESIFVLAENGDIVFANEQAARLTGYAKYDLIHKNLFELFVDPGKPKEILDEAKGGRSALRYGELRRNNGTIVPVDISAIGLLLMGKRFVQSVIRDVSSQSHLEKLLAEKERELSVLQEKLKSK
jgi:PAS domain S-box-containing protein